MDGAELGRLQDSRPRAISRSSTTQVDQASGTIRMKATFQNKDNALWPGLSVATRLLVDTLKKVILVAPNDAIQRGPNGLYAIRRRQATTRSRHSDIKVGQRATAQSVVEQGLAPRRPSRDRRPVSAD